MPIIVSGSGDYTPAPAGMHSAVCCDVVDHGKVETSFGLKHKVSLVFLIAENMENGKPYSVHRKYTASLNEKAALFKDLTSWRGKPFAPPCMLNLIHETTDGKTYANIASISPVPKGMDRMKVPPDYVRKKDRTDDAGAPVGDEPPPHTDDDDVPF